MKRSDIYRTLSMVTNKVNIIFGSILIIGEPIALFILDTNTILINYHNIRKNIIFWNLSNLISSFSMSNRFWLSLSIETSNLVIIKILFLTLSRFSLLSIGLCFPFTTGSKIMGMSLIDGDSNFIYNRVGRACTIRLCILLLTAI